MAGFQYFIKSEREKTLEVAIAESGLSMFKDRVGLQKYCTLNGGGFMFNVRGKGDDISIGLRDGQEHVEFDDFTLIYDKADKPKPGSFLKDDYIYGEFIKLGDDNPWMIPLARKIDESYSNIPSYISQKKKGVYEKIPFEKYRDIINVADEIWEDFLKSESGLIEDLKIIGYADKEYEYFEKVLQANYDLEWFEIDALKLMTDDNVKDVLYSVVDKKTLYEFYDKDEKKNG